MSHRDPCWTWETTTTAGLLCLTLFLGLGRPDVVSAEALSLQAAIEEALARNPELLAARRAWQAALRRPPQARALDDPEFSIQTWGVPLRDPVNLRRANPNIFGLRQSLPFPGKRRLKGEIAADEARIAEAQYQAKARELVAQVKKAYYDLALAEKTLRLEHEQLEVVQQMLKVAEIRYAVGQVPQQDVLRAQVAQSERLHMLIMAGQERRTAAARLNTLLNRPPGSPLGPLEEPMEVLLLERVEELTQRALAARPELAGAQAAVQKAARTRSLAEKNRTLPDFMVGLEYWLAPEMDPAHTYAAMVNVTIPFAWTQGKHRQAVEEAAVMLAMEEASAQAMRNQVLLEVQEAVARLEAAQQTLRLHREGLLPQAEQAFKATMAAYQSGKVDFGTLLEGERMLREVRRGTFRALTDVQQRLAELERAVGQDLHPPLPK
jgi:cobalt-zinc-cadmium efflux system outer membrane protein